MAHLPSPPSLLPSPDVTKHVLTPSLTAALGLHRCCLAKHCLWARLHGCSDKVCPEEALEKKGSIHTDKKQMLVLVMSNTETFIAESSKLKL